MFALCHFHFCNRNFVTLQNKDNIWSWTISSKSGKYLERTGLIFFRLTSYLLFLAFKSQTISPFRGGLIIRQFFAIHLKLDVNILLILHWNFEIDEICSTILIQDSDLFPRVKKRFFPNSMEKLVSYLGYFSTSFEKITF